MSEEEFRIICDECGKVIENGTDEIALVESVGAICVVKTIEPFFTKDINYFCSEKCFKNWCCKK